MAPVTDLATARDRRAAKTKEAFAFTRRDDLAEDDAPLGHANGLVVIVLDPTQKTGLALSPDAARRFGRALIESADLAEATPR